MSRRYGNPPLYVTENGWSTPGDEGVEAGVLDRGRVLFYANYTSEMHRAINDAAQQTDSMKMFLMGVEGGKPEGDAVGAQPEWFFKGDGSALIAPDAPLPSPS